MTLAYCFALVHYPCMNLSNNARTSRAARKEISIYSATGWIPEQIKIGTRLSFQVDNTKSGRYAAVDLKRT